MGDLHPIESAARRLRSERHSGLVAARRLRSRRHSGLVSTRRAALLGFTLLLAAGCPAEPEFNSFKGDWLGFLSLGLNTTGYNTLTIDGHNNCLLYGEINITHRLLGTYKLRVDGEPLIEYGRIFGDVTITRIWPGVDTLVAVGNWSGLFDRPTNTATGVWETNPGSPFGASGYWMSTRQR